MLHSLKINNINQTQTLHSAQASSAQTQRIKMLFKTTAVLSTFALLFAGQALGSPEANGALIATDPSE
jgi:hypothetical protein